LTLESPVARGFINIRDPDISLNGEPIEIDGHGGMMENLNVEWAEIAKGPNGKYATLEDAVRNRQLLHAIATSGKEGRTVYL
jgi:hypothetical protein